MDTDHRQKGLKTGAKLLLAALSAPLVCALLFYLFVVQPFGGGVTAELQLADGSEFRLTQTYQAWSEPYSVSFETRRPGEEWVSNYIDHQAGLWKKVEITHDEAADSIVVTKRGEHRIVLDREKWTLWFDNGSFSRTVNAEAAAVPQI